MGNKPSSPSSSSSTDALSQHWKQLFSDLAEFDEPSSTVSQDVTVFKDRFVSLFGGPSVELGAKVYKHFFHDQALDLQHFMDAMTTMKTQIVDGGDPSVFLFKMFLAKEDDSEAVSGLPKLLHAAAVCSLSAGSQREDVEVPVNHPLLTAMASALACHVDEGKEVTISHSWLTRQCPVHTDEDKEQKYNLELDLLIWVLSCVLPNIYMGGAGRRTQHSEGSQLPVGGVWTCLYSSDKHGFSLNRFQHHCYEYKHPSIMTVDCEGNHSGETHSYAITMDSEWREGAFFYGGENFHFMQLQPTYSLLKKGAKLFSLNKNQRGFPKGLRVTSSEKHDFCLFEVDSSLEQARVREGDWMRVLCISVWGCGGVEAMETQLRLKAWESKEILRRRQINCRELRSTWKDSPDCHLLEMGGVTISRPTERPES